MKRITYLVSRGVIALRAAHLIGTAHASSHQDAPLIIRDPSANTTDVYAFVQNENGIKSLVTALGVYPHEEPGVGPNKYNFDDNVLYQIQGATGRDVAAGKTTLSYEFQFNTTFRNQNTILQSYLDVINDIGDAGQNLVQTYTVTKVDHRQHDHRTLLGTGTVPPNNQGVATAFYNQGDNGSNPAKDGVATEAELDRYTTQAIKNLGGGYFAFAGQRDDGFYADILAIFDLLQLRSPGKDSQGGFNIHLMALVIPVSGWGGDQQIVGVYATSSRRQIQILRDEANRAIRNGDLQLHVTWVQVARHGNPLFYEGLFAIAVTDLLSNLRVNPPIIRGPAGDAVDFNHMAYNKVFPYDSTPQNGRNHSHP